MVKYMYMHVYGGDIFGDAFPFLNNDLWLNKWIKIAEYT